MHSAYAYNNGRLSGNYKFKQCRYEARATRGFSATAEHLLYVLFKLILTLLLQHSFISF